MMHLWVSHGVPFLAIPCTERFAETGIVFSVGRRGHPNHDGFADAVNELQSSALNNGAGPQGTVGKVRLATADGIDFWNNHSLLTALDDTPPAEFEAAYHQRLPATTAAA